MSPAHTELVEKMIAVITNGEAEWLIRIGLYDSLALLDVSLKSALSTAWKRAKYGPAHALFLTHNIVSLHSTLCANIPLSAQMM